MLHRHHCIQKFLDMLCTFSSVTVATSSMWCGSLWDSFVSEIKRGLGSRFSVLSDLRKQGQRLRKPDFVLHNHTPALQ